MDSHDYRTLPPAVQGVLRKYHLLTTTSKPGPDGAPISEEGYRISNVAQSAGGSKPLGAGPVLSPDVIERFLQVDTTPNKDWFEWMVLTSGGGKRALKQSEALFEKAKVRFIDDRVNGYRRKSDNKYFPAIPRAEAEARWAQRENSFRETLMTGDQDIVNTHPGSFGFFRNWPGKDRIYEQVTAAVARFLKLSKKTAQMNRFMSANRHTDKMVSLKPKDYEDFRDLNVASDRVERFFAAEHARKDVRIAGGPNGEKTVYADDYVTVIVPLTYAAAVKYGHDAWAWSNPASFEDNLSSVKDNWNDPWKKSVADNVFVFIQFNVPMPAWVTFSNDRFKRHTLHNLSMVVPKEKLSSFNPDTVPLYDEENNTKLTLGKLKDSIRAEVERIGKYNPEEEEYPIKRGPSPYQSAEEAEEVIKHLDAAMHAVKQWGSRFNASAVVRDYMAPPEA